MVGRSFPGPASAESSEPASNNFTGDGHHPICTCRQLRAAPMEKFRVHVRTGGGTLPFAGQRVAGQRVAGQLAAGHLSLLVTLHKVYRHEVREARTGVAGLDVRVDLCDCPHRPVAEFDFILRGQEVPVAADLWFLIAIHGDDARATMFIDFDGAVPGDVASLVHFFSLAFFLVRSARLRQRAEQNIASKRLAKK